jgi:serine racemase
MSTGDKAEVKHEHCISLSDVQEAAVRINGLATRTPLLPAPASMLSMMNSGGELNHKALYFKVEAMQRTGSFKFRGALNAVQYELENAANATVSSPPTKQQPPLAVVTHSSGNHAQALALAAQAASTEKRLVQATIVMPKGAPSIKQEGTRSYGAEVILVENTNEAREEEADRIVAERGAIFIHPSENPKVIAGQGTASLELLEQIKDFGVEKPDAVIIPVGGGGLASGNAVALRGMLGNNVKIILAEPSRLDDAKRSFDAGEPLKHAPDNKLDSVADGLKTTLGPNTWPVIRDLVDDIFTVSEEEILRATKLIWEQLKVCIEPSAGVGVAVAMGHEFNAKYTAENGVTNVVVVLCGGNVDILKTSRLMEQMGL